MDKDEAKRIQNDVNIVRKKVDENHETRISTLEATRADFRERLAGTNRYIILLSAIGVILVGLVIWALVKAPIP